MVWVVCNMLISNSSLFNSSDHETLKRFINAVLSGEPQCLDVHYSNGISISEVFCCSLGITEKEKYLKSKSLLLESCKLRGVSAGSLKITVRVA